MTPREAFEKLASSEQMAHMTHWHIFKAGYDLALETAIQVAHKTVCDVHLPTGVKIYGTRVGKALRTLKEHE